MIFHFRQKLKDSSFLIVHQKIPDSHLFRLFCSLPFEVSLILDPLLHDRHLEVALEQIIDRILIIASILYIQNILKRPVGVQYIIISYERNTLGESLKNLHPSVKSLLRGFSAHKGLLGQDLDPVGYD